MESYLNNVFAVWTPRLGSQIPKFMSNHRTNVECLWSYADVRTCQNKRSKSMQFARFRIIILIEFASRATRIHAHISLIINKNIQLPSLTHGFVVQVRGPYAVTASSAAAGRSLRTMRNPVIRSLVESIFKTHVRVRENTPQTESMFFTEKSVHLQMACLCSTRWAGRAVLQSRRHPR